MRARRARSGIVRGQRLGEAVLPAPGMIFSPVERPRPSIRADNSVKRTESCMKFWIYAAVCLGGMFSCADEHSREGDAGACTNQPECLCNDGRNGTKVCDL